MTRWGCSEKGLGIKRGHKGERTSDKGRGRKTRRRSVTDVMGRMKRSLGSIGLNSRIMEKLVR